LDTITIPPLHRAGKAAFPDELGAHVALRTIRRFLEKGYIYPQRIILAISEPALYQ